MISDILSQIGETGVVSAIRGVNPDRLKPVLEALYTGGVRCVEITMDSPDALSMLKIAKEAYSSRMLIGAGTVLDAQTARLCILSGADFILSPTLSVEMIQLCNTYSKLSVPGVFTPTEALCAYQAGAQLIKVFPVGSVGPEYVRDIKGPLKQLNLLAMGGVTLQNAKAYKEAGVYALGIGSSLVNSRLANDGKFDMIAGSAKQFIEIMKNNAVQ